MQWLLFIFLSQQTNCIVTTFRFSDWSWWGRCCQDREVSEWLGDKWQHSYRHTRSRRSQAEPSCRYYIYLRRWKNYPCLFLITHLMINIILQIKFSLHVMYEWSRNCLWFWKKTRSEKEFCRNLLLLEGTEKFYERLLKCNVSHSSNGIQLKYDKYGILLCTHWYLVLWRHNFKIMLLELLYFCDDIKIPYSALFA